jgi:uncharacterized membrane protein YdjX (TVP38/TMEM64 family)
MMRGADNLEGGARESLRVAFPSFDADRRQWLPGPMGRRTIAILAAVAVGLYAAWAFAPDLRTIVAAVEWMREAGPLGDLAFAVFFAFGTLVLFPASWNTGAAGFLYGPIMGALITLLYATTFSSAAFLLGRTVLRHRVEERIADNPRYRALDRAVAERGLVFVILIRLSPVSPFNPLNYLFSATCVRFRDFVLGTLIGGILPAIVWSRVGASVVDLTSLLSGEATGPGWVQTLGIVLTIGVTIPITLIARNAVRRALAET